MSPRVGGLFVHPIKSAAAIAVDTMVLDDRGAVGDRRWLVVDAHGMQITARDTPRLALVRPRFVDAVETLGMRVNVDGALWLAGLGVEALLVEVPSARTTRSVTVWDDTLDAHDAGDAPAQWFTHVLGKPCRLVRLAEQAQRPLAPKYAGVLPNAGRRVAFTDGAPLLLLGQASVDALNARLATLGVAPMSAARFRPNILLAQTAAHEEDTWVRLRVGSAEIAVGSPCSRCVMTTLDPATANGGVEPLRTLANYRVQDGLVMFGMNATHAVAGTVRVGEGVQVLEGR